MKKYLYVMALMCICNCAGAQNLVESTNTHSNFNIEVNELAGKINISWSGNNSAEVDYWEVQASKDGIEFATIGLVFGPQPGGNLNEFKFKQEKKKIGKGVIYFRVMPMVKGTPSVPSSVSVTK